MDVPVATALPCDSFPLSQGQALSPLAIPVTGIGLQLHMAHLLVIGSSGLRHVTSLLWES